MMSLIGNSQDTKLSRQERKEVKKAQLVKDYYTLDSLLQIRSFVLEADFLQDKYGTRIPVHSDLNFLKVDVEKGILQTGASFGLGYNGFGGLTTEGKISFYEITRDRKRHSYTVHFDLLTNMGHYDIFMTVTSNNHASATISGFGRGRLTWLGRLESIGNSRVYKGQNTI